MWLADFIPRIISEEHWENNEILFQICVSIESLLIKGYELCSLRDVIVFFFCFIGTLACWQKT